LSPDASEINNVSVADETSSARQLSLGWQVLRRLALELQVADFGQSNLDNGGRISYRETSANALWFLRPRTADARTNLFARFGFGRMDNSAEGVPFVRDNNFQRLIGVGMEYRFSSRLVGRLEYTSYDRDVNSASIGLVYSAVRRHSAHRAQAINPYSVGNALVDRQIVVTSDKPTFAAAVASESEAKNPQSNCPGAIPILTVKADDCLHYRSHIPPVYFSSGSSTLSENSMAGLSKLIDLLTQYRQTDIALHSHTDSIGTRAANIELANLRAKAVRQYLVENGVSASRLKVLVHGESQPRSTDDTETGRRQNRRVEIYAFN
jgi:outer membrane protein OmpA-like peptidoglycan-associated protein